LSGKEFCVQHRPQLAVGYADAILGDAILELIVI